MKVVVELYESELKELERLMSVGKITSIPTFISLAIRNQILMEEEQNDAPLLEYYLQTEEKEKKIVSENKLSKLDVPTISVQEIDDRFPFWGTQNKYLCLKQITRDFAQLIHEKGDKWIRYDIVMNELLQSAITTRHNFENIDKHFHRGRGEKISTGFPKNNSKSTSRYEKQFIGGIDSKGNKYGLAVEIGFLDVRLNESHRVEFALTENGLSFSKLNSPVFGKPISDLSPSTPPLSDEEISFLISVLEERKLSEIDLMLITLDYIQSGKNRPEDGASITKKYLDKKYPDISQMKKEGCFSINESETIRAGVISRLNELNLINIEKQGLKSIYKLTKSGNDFLRQRRK